MTTAILHEILTLINGIPPPQDFASRIQPFPQSKNTNAAGDQTRTPDPSSCLWAPLDPLQELFVFLEHHSPDVASLGPLIRIKITFSFSTSVAFSCPAPSLWLCQHPPGQQPQGPALGSASSCSLKVTCSHNTSSSSLSIS